MLLDQAYGQTAPGRIARDAGAIDAATDDQQVTGTGLGVT
jgi:hypothetical protein